MTEVHRRLRATFSENQDVTRKLRALWALQVTGGADSSFLIKQLSHSDENVRAWAITLLCENGAPPTGASDTFVQLAARGDSQLVRLHLASALQRLEPARRWKLAAALLSRAEDVEDQNLPLMYWYGIEPLVDTDLKRFLGLIPKTRSPLIRQFIARRAAVPKN